MLISINLNKFIFNNLCGIVKEQSWSHTRIDIIIALNMIGWIVT